MKEADHDEDDLRDIRERAARLREAVTKAGGITTVARAARMAVPTVNNYLSGRDLKTSALVKLANAMRVSVEWLATGEEAERPYNVSESSIFGRDLLESPANFSILIILLRSCQDAFYKSDKPTLREAFEWVSSSYRKGRMLPDRPIEFKNPEEPKS